VFFDEKKARYKPLLNLARKEDFFIALLLKRPLPEVFNRGSMLNLGDLKWAHFPLKTLFLHLY